MKKKLLFVITQFYKGGAEASLLNLFYALNEENYDIDFVILNQVEYADATSLIEYIPEWIHVYDIIKSNKKIWFGKIFRKIFRKIFHAETYGRVASRLIKKERYDIAFSYGEWLSPEFVARKVNAKKKYIWIHIDLDKAGFVNKKELVKYDKEITGYIFASEKSMQGSILHYSKLRDKSSVIHNFINRENIIIKSEEKISTCYSKFPYLLSVGNLRVEKNYPRQIEVMKLLKERGILIKWLCIGSTINKAVYEEVIDLLDEYKLKNDFIFCGVDDNPYKYMKNALAVMVLSDYESWSLVISESKILGIPVIATNTSGAQEQIVDGETGMITGFDVKNIADQVETFLKSMSLQTEIRKNLKSIKENRDGYLEFEKLVEEINL